MKQRIHIIGTGGTIAGVSRSADASPAQSLIAYDAGILSVDTLLQGLPTAQLNPLRVRFDFTSEQLVNIDSKDMNPEVWWRLAQRLQSLSKDEAIQGVVITHGTDTLEETSFFIESLRQSGAFARVTEHPAMSIVFTAAMRPADAVDADGPQNLIDALSVAAHVATAPWGSVCVLHGRIHSALTVNKAHSTAMDAFSSVPEQALGQILQGRVMFDSEPMARTSEPTDLTALVNTLKQGTSIRWPWVALVMSHAGIDACVITSLMEAGVEGIVVAATGNGTLSKTLIAPLQAAQSKGIRVLRASRVWQGGVTAYPRDEFAACGSTSAVKARVRLMLDMTESRLS